MHYYKILNVKSIMIGIFESHALETYFPLNKLFNCEKISKKQYEKLCGNIKEKI